MTRIYAMAEFEEGEIRAYKIGISNDPHRRLRHIRLNGWRDVVLLGSRPGVLSEEKSIHRRLDEYRLRGEWYIVADAVEHEISDICRKRPGDRYINGRSPGCSTGATEGQRALPLARRKTGVRYAVERHDSALLRAYVAENRDTVAPREMDVFLLCVEQELSASDAAVRLGLSRRTVENYLYNLRKRASRVYTTLHAATG